MLYVVPWLGVAEEGEDEHPDIAAKPIANPPIRMQRCNRGPALRQRLSQQSSIRSAIPTAPDTDVRGKLFCEEEVLNDSVTVDGGPLVTGTCTVDMPQPVRADTMWQSSRTTPLYLLIEAIVSV
jgi:hypothetical protein